MTDIHRRHDNALLFVGLVFACGALLATWKNNQEIAKRRLHDPVATVGKLHSASCASFRHGIGIKPYAALNYDYAAEGGPQPRYRFATSKWFETTADCQEFVRLIKNESPLWYERAHPDRATFYPEEPDSWGLLVGLIPAAIFGCLGMSARRVSKGRKKARRG